MQDLKIELREIARLIAIVLVFSASGFGLTVALAAALSSLH
jgi:hypothetical protein